MTKSFPIYEISFNILIELLAHSLSNIGNGGTNRLLPRRQLLADGQEVDSISGGIQKSYNARILAEYFAAAGIPLCPACARLDGRRAGALVDDPDYKQINMEAILSGCGLCDTHGFLITGKTGTNGDKDAQNQDRERLRKHSLVEFSFALAQPDHQTDTPQLFSRHGEKDSEGQMLMKKISRSASYGICVRYKAAGVGIDTEEWKLFVDDEMERLNRHRMILRALRDTFLSPSGASSSAMLPHLAGLSGAIAVQKEVGRAPVYSPLEEDFVTVLTGMATSERTILTFNSANEFSSILDDLIANSSPHLPKLARKK